MRATGNKKEAEVLSEILAGLLPFQEKIWFSRYGVGRVKIGERYVAFGQKGVSDIIGVSKNGGRFFGIEVKRPGNEKGQTKEQKAFQRRMKDLNAVCIVGTSVEQVIEDLQKEGII